MESGHGIKSRWVPEESSKNWARTVPSDSPHFRLGFGYPGSEPQFPVRLASLVSGLVAQLEASLEEHGESGFSKNPKMSVFRKKGIIWIIPGIFTLSLYACFMFTSFSLKK